MNEEQILEAILDYGLKLAPKPRLRFKKEVLEIFNKIDGIPF